AYTTRTGTTARKSGTSSAATTTTEMVRTSPTETATRTRRASKAATTTGTRRTSPSTRTTPKQRNTRATTTYTSPRASGEKTTATAATRGTPPGRRQSKGGRVGAAPLRRPTPTRPTTTCSSSRGARLGGPRRGRNASFVPLRRSSRPETPRVYECG